MTRRRALLIFSASLCLGGITSCASKYSARGVVLDVDAARSTVTVSHEAIPGYMDAMVMPFTVRDPEQISDVRPGDRVAFRLNVRKSRSWIDRLQLLSAAPIDIGLTQTPAVSTLVKIGDPVPDFTLTNQDGRPLSLSSLRGKVVAVTFIYTRCPLPDYCPRMITNLQAVERRFPQRVGNDVELVAVTFDPQYDTPKRMKEYAQFFKADRPGWQFLTGPMADIERVCGFFGVEFYPEEGLITHTLQTAVIDKEGKLAAAVEGKDYSGRQLSDLVGQYLR